MVRELRDAGLRVSVDSFDPDEIRTAVDAGAEMVLSVNASNIAIAERYAGSDKRFVVVPDAGDQFAELERSLEHLERWRVTYLIDPILEPIGFGFMASLERYAEAHRRWPTVPQMMGIGNITELTAADTTGMNALLIAICQELGVRAVLTTEVIPWARGSVREIDVARRLMHYAVSQKTVPKRVDDRLVTREGPAHPRVHRGGAARAAGPGHRSRTSASSPTATPSPSSIASGSCAAPTSRRSSASSASTRRRTPSTSARS